MKKRAVFLVVDFDDIFHRGEDAFFIFMTDEVEEVAHGISVRAWDGLTHHHELAELVHDIVVRVFKVFVDAASDETDGVFNFRLFFFIETHVME